MSIVTKNVQILDSDLKNYTKIIILLTSNVQTAKLQCSLTFKK